MTKEDLLKLLRADGWHISDGVDSCSGEDREEEEKSAEIIAKYLKS